MPGIFTSLSSAAYSLQSQSLSVQQAGKNISNINNENYSRQRVLMGSLGTQQTEIGPTSGPLVALGLEQVRDIFIDRQLLGEISYLSTLESQDFRLRQALANLGDTINRTTDAQFVGDITQQGGGLRGAIDSFFDAFESFSARPNDSTTRQVVYQSAEALVDAFHRIDTRYDLLETELDAQMVEETRTLNDFFEELAGINLEIARLEVDLPKSALDLRDLRQQKLEEISEYALIEVNEVQGADGQVEVTLLDDSGNKVTIVGPGAPTKEIFFDTDTRTFKVVGSGETLDLQAGLLPAVLEVQTDYVAEIRAKLDSVANSIATEVNELYYQAFDDSGSPVIPEVSFFQQPTPPPSMGGTGTATAASIALYSTPSDPLVTAHTPLTAASLRATATGISGANELALAIGDLATTAQADLGNISFSEYSARIVTELGQDIRNIQNRMEVQQDVNTLLKARRGEISGVSLDEEVSTMIQYQRAYQATSRYFNVLSDMLDTLINGLGR